MLRACSPTRPPQSSITSTSPILIPSPGPGSLLVDASAYMGLISPLVYGSNYGPWVAVPLDMLPAAEVWLFDVDHKAEQVDSALVFDRSQVNLPGQSVALIVIP